MLPVVTALSKFLANPFRCRCFGPASFLSTTARPHSALGYLTPAAYAANFTATDGRLRNPTSSADRPLLPPRHKAQNRRGSNRRWMTTQWQVRSSKFITLPLALRTLRPCILRFNAAKAPLLLD
jgi:hypothetical protein